MEGDINFLKPNTLFLLDINIAIPTAQFMRPQITWWSMYAPRNDIYCAHCYGLFQGNSPNIRLERLRKCTNRFYTKGHCSDRNSNILYQIESHMISGVATKQLAHINGAAETRCL